MLVIASGVNRVDERAVAALLGEKLGRADADFVRAETGFVIGGVPPVGHDKPIETFIDEDILAFDSIWAAAGTPFAVFRLDPHSLAALTGGHVARVALPPARFVSIFETGYDGPPLRLRNMEKRHGQESFHGQGQRPQIRHRGP